MLYQDTDVSYLLTIQSLTTEQLHYRRDQLNQVRKYLIDSILFGDALALANSRIATINTYLVMRASYANKPVERTRTGMQSERYDLLSATFSRSTQTNVDDASPYMSTPLVTTAR